ncbi:MAG: hypothetical protein IAG13_19105 [Deltaproteobacteria bacterium]|nr:hypothetical protein [Nannocystaceae bacterium]
MNFASERGDYVGVDPSWLPWALTALSQTLPQIRYLAGQESYQVRHGETSAWAQGLRNGLDIRLTEVEPDLMARLGRLPKDPSLAKDLRDRELARALERDAIYRALWQGAELFEHADANGLWVEFTEYG